jgi:phage terminase large subunit GpA-like protein
VKRHKGQNIFGIKGQGGENLPIVGSPNRKRSGTVRRPIDLYPVGVDQAKSIVIKRLKISEQGAGYCHFPSTRDVDYFRMLTSEKMVTKFVKGFPKREYHKLDGRRNEALDCRVYAFAAWFMSIPQLDKVAFRIKQMKEQLKPDEQKPDVVIEVPKAVSSETTAQDQKPETVQNDRKLLKPRRDRSGGYLNKWRL